MGDNPGPVVSSTPMKRKPPSIASDAKSAASFLFAPSPADSSRFSSTECVSTRLPWRAASLRPSSVEGGHVAEAELEATVSGGYQVAQCHLGVAER
jgi:hypothetical protein